MSCPGRNPEFRPATRDRFWSAPLAKSRCRARSRRSCRSEWIEEQPEEVVGLCRSAPARWRSAASAQCSIGIAYRRRGERRIFDVDTRIDDALAVIYLLASPTPIIGITSRPAETSRKGQVREQPELARIAVPQTSRSPGRRCEPLRRPVARITQSFTAPRGRLCRAAGQQSPAHRL